LLAHYCIISVREVNAISRAWEKKGPPTDLASVEANVILGEEATLPSPASFALRATAGGQGSLLRPPGYGGQAGFRPPVWISAFRRSRAMLTHLEASAIH